MPDESRPPESAGDEPTQASPATPWGAPAGTPPPTTPPWGSPPPQAPPVPPPAGGGPPAPGSVWAGPSPTGGWSPASVYFGGPYGTPFGAPPRWYALRGLATALTILLWICFGSSLIAAALNARERSLFEDAVRGDFSALGDLGDAESAANGFGGLTVFMTLAIATVFIIWFWRCAKNLQALGRFGGPMGPGWAIGAWFVPFASWVMPAVLAADMWRGSDARIAGGDPSWRRAPVGKLLFAWWIPWAGGNALYSIWSMTASGDNLATSPSDYRAENTMQTVALALLTVASVTCVMFVRRLTARFDETLAAQQQAWNVATKPPAGPPAGGFAP